MTPTLFHRRFAPQGSAPGTLVVPEETVEPVVRVISYDRETLEESSPAWEELFRQGAAPPDRVTWIDVQGLGDGSVVRAAAGVFDLHRLAVADVVNVGQRPKVETYDEHLFVVLRMVTLADGGPLHSEQVSLFLGRHWVLTFQERHGDCLDRLRERVRDDRRPVRAASADYLASMVIDAVVDGYFPVLERLGDLLEDYEEAILRRPTADVLSSLYAIKREIAILRRSVWPLRDALHLLVRDEVAPISKAALPYLRDATDHAMQVVDMVENYRELGSSLVDVYLSMVGQRTNEIMRVLTIVATIFIPLTFVAGIYGMNFDTSRPGNLPELSWPYGYALFWGVCITLAVLLLALFRRLGWLGGSDSEPG